MTTNTLPSYALALALLLAMIFTVGWGVRRILVSLTDLTTGQPSRIQVRL